MFEVLFGYGNGTNTNILQNLSKLILIFFFLTNRLLQIQRPLQKNITGQLHSTLCL